MAAARSASVIGWLLYRARRNSPVSVLAQAERPADKLSTILSGQH